MTLAASTWVWDEAPVGGVDKLVLLWLAENNGHATAEKVSTQCGISRSEAALSLARLYLSGAWERIAEWQTEYHYRENSSRPRLRPSTAIPNSLRIAVLARDGLVCQICTLVVEPTDVHLDHRIPLSKGGPTTLENLQVAHRLCNIRKGNR